MATPAGEFRLLFGYYRSDRLRLSIGGLDLQSVSETNAWCDDPNHPCYNRPVSLPFSSSHEKMNRQDSLYDIVIVMDHNFTKRIRGRGSAVFFHLTAEKPFTAGCVAISRQEMLKILPLLSDQTIMRIIP